MIKRITLVSVMLGFASAAMFAVASPSSASAADSCDAVIVDSAGVLNDSQAVEKAASRLADIGADVRVRTLPSLDGKETNDTYATIDAYIDQMVKSCPSWQGAGGNRKSNLVVYAMTKEDRKLGVFYGEGWTNAFEASGGEQRIWADFMIPRFRDGDFSGGFVAAINETHRVFDEYLHPKPAPQQPSSPPIVEEATDLSGFVPAVLIAVIAAAIIALLVFGYFVLKRRKEAFDRRMTMRQRALAARDATTRITFELDDAAKKAVRVAQVKKFSTVGGDESHQLTEALQRVEDEYGLAVDAVASAQSDSATADDKDLSEGEYEQIAMRFETALEHAKAAQKADAYIKECVADIERQLSEVPNGIAASLATHEGIASQVRTLENGLIKVDDIRASLAKGKLEIESATAKSAELAAIKHLQQASSLLQQTQALIDDLASKRQQLSEEVPALAARITKLGKDKDKARECFDRIKAAFAEPNWRAIVGNGTEAEKRIVAAGESHQQATELSGVKSQKWDAALAAVQVGNSLLDKAASLLSSITKLEKHLNNAKQHASEEIQAVRSDIDKVSDYIATYDEDIREVHEQAVVEARSVLDSAAAMLAQPTPDYLTAVDTIEKARAHIDHVYSQAVAEHEAAERIRQQAAAAVQQAKAAISKAHEFIEDHDSDVGSIAEASLRNAQQRLSAIDQGDAPESVIEVAGGAIRFAQEAYNKASKDFEDAEDDRRRAREAARRAREEEEARERRSRESSYSHSSSFDFGSSSSSWGSSSDGGGSSGGFGGGGDGGGSSGSW